MMSVFSYKFGLTLFDVSLRMLNVVRNVFIYILSSIFYSILLSYSNFSVNVSFCSFIFNILGIMAEFYFLILSFSILFTLSLFDPVKILWVLILNSLSCYYVLFISYVIYNFLLIDNFFCHKVLFRTNSWSV